MQYTVEELIEVLQQCPPNYSVCITSEVMSYRVSAIGIDHGEEIVDIFVD